MMEFMGTIEKPEMSVQMKKKLQNKTWSKKK